MDTILHVACGIIVNNGKVLVAQRPAHKQHGGLWEFPGGKIHEHESAINCIIRELHEELNVVVEVKKTLPLCSYRYHTHNVLLYPFVVSIISGVPMPLEHSAIQWMFIDELYNLNWVAADITVLEHFIKCNKLD